MSTAADLDVIYPCVGICWPDPERDCCMGCGRPLTAASTEPQSPPSPPVPVDETDTT